MFDALCWTDLLFMDLIMSASLNDFVNNSFASLGDSMDPKVAEALNQVALPVVLYETCKRMDYWWFQVKTSMICCGFTLPDDLKSVCQV